MSGGRDGKVRLFNPENLQQKACLSYHQAPIYSLDISGNYGLSGSNDRSICLWNMKKYKIKNIFKGHQKAIISLKFIKNSRLFVSGSYDQTARIWNYSKNSLLFIILFNSSLIYLCISHQKFIFVFEDGKIQQMSRSKFLSRTNLRARVFCSKFAEEIEVLVTGHEDGCIQFINSKSFCLFDRFRGHTSSVISIGFCKYSKNFVSCSNDCSIKLWSSKPFKLLKVFKNLEYPTCCVEILKDEIYLGNLQIEKLDIQTRRTINKANLSSYLCFSVSIQLNLIVYGLDVVCLMSLKSLKYVNSKPVNCKIIYLCFFKSIIVCGLHTGHILYLDCPSLMIKRRYLLTRLPIYSIVPSSDLNVLVYSTFNKTSFVDLKSMKSLKSHNNRIISGKFALSMFMFIDDLCTLYIVKNFEKCRKISYTQPGSQLFLFKSNKYIIIKEFSSEVTLINLEKPENYERLYCLKELVKRKDKRDFYMKRSDLILSSLNTYMLLS